MVIERCTRWRANVACSLNLLALYLVHYLQSIFTYVTSFVAAVCTRQIPPEKHSLSHSTYLICLRACIRFSLSLPLFLPLSPSLSLCFLFLFDFFLVHRYVCISLFERAFVFVRVHVRVHFAQLSLSIYFYIYRLYYMYRHIYFFYNPYKIASKFFSPKWRQRAFSWW